MAREVYHRLVLFLAKRSTFATVALRLVTAGQKEVRLFSGLDDHLCISPRHMRPRASLLFRESKTLFYAPPRFVGSQAHPPSELIPVRGPDHYGAVFSETSIVGGSGLLLVGTEHALCDLRCFDENRRYKYTDAAILAYDDERCVVWGQKAQEELKSGIH